MAKKTTKTTNGLLPTFSTYVFAVMAKKGLNAEDVVRLTENRISSSVMSRIKQGYAPEQPDAVDALADALHDSRHTLRLMALSANADKEVNKLCKRWRIDKAELFLDPQKESTPIPVFRLQNLYNFLTPGGIPKTSISSATLKADTVTRYSFAIHITDNRLYPKLEIGDVCIVSPGVKVLPEKLGLLCAGKSLYLGKITISDSIYTVTTLNPFISKTFRKKDIAYVFPVVRVDLCHPQLIKT